MKYHLALAACYGALIGSALVWCLPSERLRLLAFETGWEARRGIRELGRKRT